MRSGQRGDKLKRAGAEASDDPLRAADEDVFVPDGHAIGTCSLERAIDKINAYILDFGCSKILIQVNKWKCLSTLE